jgi:hypothetical protein
VLEQVRRVPREGLPGCYRGDAGAWLADLYSDLPWDEGGWAEAARILLTDPEFEVLARVVLARHGEDIAADLRAGLEGRA